MATAERPVRTADDRAWDLFFEALDPDSASAARISPGAAILAANAPDRDALVRRYHADRRTVVVVHEDGCAETLKPSQLERILLLGGLAVLGAWALSRGGQRIPA